MSTSDDLIRIELDQAKMKVDHCAHLLEECRDLMGKSNAHRRRALRRLERASLELLMAIEELQ